jgi:hypothetical protein
MMCIDSGGLAEACDPCALLLHARASVLWVASSAFYLSETGRTMH